MRCPRPRISGDTKKVKKDVDAALLWIEENQLGRRNLADDQRAIIAGRVAKRRAAASVKDAAKLREAEKRNGARNNDALVRGPMKRTEVEVAKENKLTLGYVVWSLDLKPRGRRRNCALVKARSTTNRTTRLVAAPLSPP